MTDVAPEQVLDNAWYDLPTLAKRWRSRGGGSTHVRVERAVRCRCLAVRVRYDDYGSAGAVT